MSGFPKTVEVAMAMVPCRECGGSVSSEAALCPHCGIREPAGAVAGAHAHDRAHAGPVHDRHDRHDHAPVRRRGGKAGWMVAFLLLLVLAALFGLWYTNIVNFT
jgi:hypothetical protein